MKKEVKIWRSEYTANIPAEILDDVRSKHPNKYISIHFNTRFELDQLAHNESVLFGDGKHFVIILKSK